MDYLVWTKEEYGELYKLATCGDLPAARREIDKAVRAGLEPTLTVEVPYELSIKVGEPGGVKLPTISVKEKYRKGIKEVIESETKEDQAEPDQGPGAPGNSQV